MQEVIAQKVPPRQEPCRRTTEHFSSGDLGGLRPWVALVSWPACPGMQQGLQDADGLLREGEAVPLLGFSGSRVRPGISLALPAELLI
jgi:hypothetical protein